MKKLRILCALACLAASPILTGSSVQEIKDEGDFKLIFESPQSSDFDNIARFVSEQGRFNELIDHLNENFALPVDITVRFTEGDGPFFRPSLLQVWTQGLLTIQF
jgi:hypothetical protein